MQPPCCWRWPRRVTLPTYQFTELEEKARQDIPALMNSRTIPKAVGYEQVTDSQPWYTKTG